MSMKQGGRVSAHSPPATYIVGGARHIPPALGDACERRLAGANFAQNRPVLNPDMVRAVSEATHATKGQSARGAQRRSDIHLAPLATFSLAGDMSLSPSCLETHLLVSPAGVGLFLSRAIGP